MATGNLDRDDGIPPSILPTNGWIISPRADLLLFLGTPLVLLTAFTIAERIWSLTAITVFATVLAMGHYMPGLMRAYGDPALFQRFRWRFILAPAVLITVSVILANYEIQAFLIVVVVWGAWHWLMQSYGLARIYDAKVKNFDATSARLDYAMCIGWFGLLYWQTDGASAIVMRYYRAGGRVPPQLLHGACYAWIAATAVLSVFYAVHLIRRWRQGHRPSVLKLALLGISFFFYLYAFGYTRSKLVAFALFEGFHDIQYLAIVWVFNRNRAAKDPGAGALTRFLFRERWPLVLLYVLLCFGFGSYDYFARSLGASWLANSALGLITGFALVHFYFDGFIWRIREPTTSSVLNVETGENQVKRRLFSPGVRHGLLWVALTTPVLALAGWEAAGKAPSDVEACRRVLAVRPTSHKANYLLASELFDLQEFEEAKQHVDRCRAIRPGYDLYDMLYADIVLRETDLTTEQLDEIIDCYAQSSQTRGGVAKLHQNWGKALQRRGKNREAKARFKHALQLDPNQPNVWYDLAVLHVYQNNQHDAVASLLAAIRVDPNHKESHSLLATIRMEQGQHQLAVRHFEYALQQMPEGIRLRLSLAKILATSSDSNVRNLPRAIQHADRLASRAESLPANVVSDLASIYAAAGKPDQASALTRQADTTANSADD